MTKNTKNLLMLGGVVVVGYLLYKKYGKGVMTSTTTKSTSTSATSSFTGSDDFFNASGTRRIASGCTGDGCIQMCSEGCEGGYCMVPQYNERGQITGYLQARCGGTYGSGVLVGSKRTK